MALGLTTEALQCIDWACMGDRDSVRSERRKGWWGVKMGRVGIGGGCGGGRNLCFGMFLKQKPCDERSSLSVGVVLGL